MVLAAGVAVAVPTEVLVATAVTAAMARPGPREAMKAVAAQRIHPA